MPRIYKNNRRFLERKLNSLGLPASVKKEI